MGNSKNSKRFSDEYKAVAIDFTKHILLMRQQVNLM